GMCVDVVDKAINNSGQPEQATIDYFTEGLSITSASNESARDFFNENDGQVVYIHAEIGAHRNSERNHSIVDEYLGEEAFSELISSGEVSGKALPLLADDRDTGFLVLELENQRRLTFSYASMGIIAGIIRGFFEVDITSQGPLAGRRVVYTLREVTASPELRSKFAEVQPEYTTFR
ncbi:hypothetical protein GYB61_05175, partial [bacterium]|nr:hypothetical protein [bacterium]